MSDKPMPDLDLNLLKQIVREIVTTRPDEIGCSACFEQLDRFAEGVLSGKNIAEVMPLVQDHLDHCPECCQEFEVLLSILRHVA